MAEKILLQAKSGSGKTVSCMNMDPAKVMMIQVIPKRLTFPNGKEWKQWNAETKTGSLMPLTRLREIAEAKKISFLSVMKAFIKSMLTENGKEVIIIDDLVYVMTQSFMKNINEKGFDKWNELADEVNKALTVADEFADDARIYFLTHIEEDMNGNIKMKTAGKLVDNLVTPEGYFNIVIGMEVKDNKHWFKVESTHPTEPYKSPMGLFKESSIPSDLEDFDTAICGRYGIEKKIDEKALTARRKLNDTGNQKAHDKRVADYCN